MSQGDESLRPDGNATEASQALGWRSAEEARQLPPRFVHALYRLVKGCLLHAESNQAVTQLVDFTLETVAEYCNTYNCESVSVLFAAKTVFVNRQMLRASRETYELARELGELLDTCGVNEVTVQKSVSRGDVAEFGGLVAGVQRDRSLAEKVRSEALAGIRARNVTGFGAGGLEGTPVQRASRTFAASVMMVRTFYTDLKNGKYELPHGIKRIAQKLVTQTEHDSRLLVAIAAAPAADSDRASLAVSTAILALSMAQQLTTDRTALASLASAALLYDGGRPRLQGAPVGSIERRLNEEEEERVPASTVVTLSVVGKMHPPSVARTVLAYEALALRGNGRPYGGRRSPLILSRVLATARAFTELRVSEGTESALSIDDAIQVVASQAQDATERVFVKLLVGALGIFPAGTMVELNTGEMGVVTATPLYPADFARPPVRILYDARANLMEQPLDLDLAHPGPNAIRRMIRRPVDADDQQMKQMRAYVVGLTTAKKRAQTRSIRRPMPVPTAEPGGASMPPHGELQSTRPPPRRADLDALQPRARQVTEPPPSQAPRRGLMEITLNPAAPVGFAPPASSPSAAPPHPSQTPTVAPKARKVRPVIARRDPRAEDDDGAGVSSPPLPNPPLAPPLSGNIPGQIRKQTGSTKQVTWEQYNTLVEKSEPSVEGVAPLATARSSAPVSSPPADTDSLLAAYLAEEAAASSSRIPSSGGLRWAADDKPESSKTQRPPSSGGLRWGEPRSSPAASSPSAASSVEPSSSPGPARGSIPSSGGLRWGSDPAGARSSGGLRWGSSPARPKSRAPLDSSEAGQREDGEPSSDPGDPTAGDR